MPRPTIYGEWTVKYTYTDAQLVETFVANVGVFQNMQNARLTFIPVDSGPPPIFYPEGLWPQWRDNPITGPHAPNVWHTVQWAHTPTIDNWIIDGVLVAGISPALQAAYEANEAANPMNNVGFDVLGAKNLAFDNTAVVTYGPIKLGTYLGANDILDYQPLIDGLAPWSAVVGAVQITPDGLQLGPADGGGGILDNPNGVTFNVDQAWPPTFTFHCSFSVGVTRNLRSFSLLPPPDDIILVQAALPETLLSQGYRIEFGAYRPDGTPQPRGTVRDATIALPSLDEPEDET